MVARTFEAAGPGDVRSFLERLPKAELHVHLDGSPRPASLIELARDAGRPLPTHDPDELASLVRADDGTDLETYLDRFQLILTALQTEEALERVTFELAEDSAAENVRYLELRYCPLLHTAAGLTPQQAVEAPLRALRRARDAYGIEARVILSGLRTLPPATTLDVARLALEYRAEGVVALDLAGAEGGHPPSEHREAFELARRRLLPATLHAGEGAGPDSIREALDCGALRIGHGTRLQEDPALQAWVRDRGIPLEVCLTSNVQTRVARSVAEHPLRRYFDDGLIVTLSTDNRLVSGTTLTEEYVRAHEQLGFTLGELVDVARMGFESAFLPLPAKRALRARVEEEIANLARP